MNVYATDGRPATSAKRLCDKHLKESIGQVADVLMDPHRSTAGLGDARYVEWASASQLNYLWLLEYGKYLCSEHVCRFTDEATDFVTILWCETNAAELEFGVLDMTPLPKNMPDIFTAYKGVFDQYIYYYLFLCRDASRQQEPMTWTGVMPPTFIYNEPGLICYEDDSVEWGVWSAWRETDIYV